MTSTKHALESINYGGYITEILHHNKFDEILKYLLLMFISL